MLLEKKFFDYLPEQPDIFSKCSDRSYGMLTFPYVQLHMTKFYLCFKAEQNDILNFSPCNIKTKPSRNASLMLMTTETKISHLLQLLSV